MKRQKIEWVIETDQDLLCTVQLPFSLTGYPQCESIFQNGVSSTIASACLEKVIEIITAELSVYTKPLGVYIKSADLAWSSPKTEECIKTGPHLLIAIESQNTMVTNKDLNSALDAWVAAREENHDCNPLLIKCLNSLVDQQSLREQLLSSIGVAFVPNGSILPLAKSNSLIAEATWKSLSAQVQAIDKDAAGYESAYVPFTSPPSLEAEFALPHRGVVRGMLVPAGVVVIAGGGYHGKSTLLTALKQGVFDHLPGHGCELVICRPRAHAIRSEEGRFVGGVDISKFISELPAFAQIDPANFATNHASGSTSMAANVIEALEADAQILLLDEDTCATNFMIRDSRMRALVSHEPITPFIYRVNGLFNRFDISTIVVIGGAGDWFDVQNCTVLMDNYQALDRTSRANSISKSFCTGRVQYNGRGLVHQLPWELNADSECTVVPTRYLVLASVMKTLGVSLASADKSELDSTVTPQSEHIIHVGANVLHHSVAGIRSAPDGRRLLLSMAGASDLEVEFSPLDQHICTRAGVLAAGCALVYLLLRACLMHSDASHGVVSIDTLSKAYDDLSYHQSSDALSAHVLGLCEGLPDATGESGSSSDDTRHCRNTLRRLCVLEHKRSFLFALHRLRGLQFTYQGPDDEIES